MCIEFEIGLNNIFIHKKDFSLIMIDRRIMIFGLVVEWNILNDFFICISYVFAKKSFFFHFLNIPINIDK